MNMTGKLMRERFGQVEFYSDAEYLRRWALARSVLDEQDVDLLLIVDSAREGHDTWFTGRKYVDTIIVPRDDVIYAVLHREYDEKVFPSRLDSVDYQRYVKQREPEIQREGLRYLNDLGACGVAELISRYSPKRIGIVNCRLLTHELKKTLNTKLPGVELVDVKQALDIKKTVKSKEELASLRFASCVHEQLIEALKFIVRPGRSMTTINSEAREYLMGLGATGDLHAFIGYLGKQDEPCTNLGPEDQIIRYGDRLRTIYESNCYGGHHTAMGRQITVGPATESYKKAVEYAAELNLFAAAMMKPGNTLGQIRRATEEKAKSDGTSLIRMCWMHGLTTDGFYEQFALNDYGMEWPLVEGAVLHCHPVHLRYFPELGPEASEPIVLLNTYVVTKEGGKSLVNFNKRPFDIVEIDC